MNPLKIVALIIAAGDGRRLGGDVPKQYILLKGKPIIFYTLNNFLNCEKINNLRVVIKREHKRLYDASVLSFSRNSKLLKPIYGGDARQESVFLGLQSLESIRPDIVVIHDACRPFVSSENLNRYIDLAIKYDGSAPALPIFDTIKTVEGDKIVGELDRGDVKIIQTPQIFDYLKIFECHKLIKKLKPSVSFTDDTSLMLDGNIPVHTFMGAQENFKITTIEDLIRARNYLESSVYSTAKKENKYEFRIGSGYDIHKFAEAGDSKKEAIVLCGVKIPHDRGILAHSDGDVCAHAIVDAILGAMGRGDIGEYFSSEDERWLNSDSTVFLEFIKTLMKKLCYFVVNIDLTIICESPRISPYKLAMKKKLAHILGLNMNKINIKVTTSEGLGSLGRKEGIAAQAAVLLGFL